MSLEHELRRVLQRTDPPSGFDERVMSRIARGDTAPVTTVRRRWVSVVLPIAASVMVAVGASYYVQQQQQRQARAAQVETEQHVSDVVLALRVASETVAAAQARVEEITRYEPTKDY
jgi:hypothetical protein